MPLQSSGETIRIEYVPRNGLLALSVINFLLSLITLSLYRFWAKTNTRRHIWACVHINGQPLEYTGRGLELFWGALIVFAVFGLPTLIIVFTISIALGPNHPAIFGVQLLFFLIIAILWGAAVYRARRYQLSRTLWRGIRGTLTGSSMVYSLLYFGAMLARAMTMGWSTPALNLELQQKMTGEMRFGDTPFRFKGRAGPLYSAYAICWFINLVVAVALTIAIAIFFTSNLGGDFKKGLDDLFASLSADESSRILILVAVIFGIYLLFGLTYSIIWSFYTARELAIFASYTTFDTARFRLDATAGSLIALVLGNLLIWIFTLGIGQPYVQQRLVRYLCDRIKVDGTIDVGAIRQSMAPLAKVGEGLADAFDVGGI